MKNQADYFLTVLFVVLTVFGIVILNDVSSAFSQMKAGDSYYFLSHQLIYGVIPGLALAFFLYKIKLDFLKKWSLILLLINLFLLSLVFLPKISLVSGGASRWINIGGFSFQPAEFLKITFILYLAAWLSSRINNRKILKKPSLANENNHQIATLVAFIVIIGLIALFLLSQPNISTFGLIAAVGTMMYFLAGTAVWQTIFVAILGGSTLWALMNIFPHSLKRLIVFMNPGADSTGLGYQLSQTLIAVGSGGIFGVGLGMSTQKFGFIPSSITDSVFAVYAEETGLLGSLILIVIFVLFFWRGMRIARAIEDKFLQLVSIGISSWIVLQAMVNIGAMTGLLPLAGIPLPFISYGGSHIIAELAGLGILLNISKQS